MTDYTLEGAQRRWDDVAVPVVKQRRHQQSAHIAQCIQIANRYNADYAVPVMGNDPDTANPVLSPAIINEAIDVPAIRASSTNPMIRCPWLSDKTDVSRERAETRRKILASTYHRSGWDRARRRFFRHVAGYAMGSLAVVPEESKGRRDGMPLARIILRNPLCTYADPRSPEELDLCNDVGFVHQMSASALRARYPRSRSENYGGVVPPIEANGSLGELWDVLEWMDQDYTLIGIMGRSYSESPFREPAGAIQLLSWFPNRTGLVPAIAPTIITLDKIVSRLTHMIGKADVLSYLMELDIAQMQRSIAPDRYVIAGENEEPTIVSNGGQWVDGRTGQINIVKGARLIGEVSGKPDPNNLARMQFLERNARNETGLVGAVGGETGGFDGGLRTGRGIDSLMAASVDPAVAELQEIGAQALTILNEGIFAMYQEYWPQQKFVVFSGWPGDRGICTFTPATDIETRFNLVYYPLPGADQYAMTVQLSQMVAAEMMSKSTARRMHPWIDEADDEEQLLDIERITSLVWQALAARAAQGGLPPIDAAGLIGFIRAGKTIEEAITLEEAAARARQASTTDQGQPVGGAPTGPAAMPGLGNPGEGSAAGAAPPPGQPVNAQALLAALTSKTGPPPGTAPPGGGSQLPVPTGAPA